MYSKNEKYKQVLQCAKILNNIKEIIDLHIESESYTQLVQADYYWHPVQGLVVVIDGKGTVLQWYKNYKMLNRAAYPINTIGQLIYSKPFGVA